MGRLTTALLVALWFMLNIGVLLLNKALLSSYAFDGPCTLTALHVRAPEQQRAPGRSHQAQMCACWLVAAVATRVLLLVPPQSVQSSRQLRAVALLAIVFAASVVLGNVSLRFISVSFNQAISAADPAFTAAFALLVLRKRETPAVYAALLPVVAGTVLASGFEPSFHAAGFCACLGAAAARALKSVLQESLLRDGEKLHSLNLLALMAPLALCVLLPLAALTEPGAPAAALHLVHTAPGFKSLLLLNCACAAGVNLANFAVTRATSALTLQVLGKAKSVLAVLLSLALFRNPVSVGGQAGYGLTLAGVALYGRAKARARARAEREDIVVLPLLSPS